MEISKDESRELRSKIDKVLDRGYDPTRLFRGLRDLIGDPDIDREEPRWGLFLVLKALENEVSNAPPHAQARRPHYRRQQRRSRVGGGNFTMHPLRDALARPARLGQAARVLPQVHESYVWSCRVRRVRADRKAT